MTTDIDPPIGGWCLPGLEPVRDAFRTNFVERGEVGAAVCVIRDGEVIVNLWGGWADEARSVPWQRDTIVNFYSAGKAMVATLLLRLVDAGRIGLDTRVSDVWPEFGVGGKHDVTVRQALSHQAGVPAIRQLLTNDDLADWATMTAALAATDTWWPIGTRHDYHTNTYGFLIGEIVRRVSDTMPDVALRTLAAELDADVSFGVETSQRHRCAEVIWAPTQPSAQGGLDVAALAEQLEGDSLMNVLAHFNPPGASSIGLVNTDRWRSMVVPSTNGHGSGRGIARFYAGLLEPGRVLSEELRTIAASAQSSGPCSILGEDLEFGLGFVPTSPKRPYGPNPGAFGHFGTGGAAGFGDPVGGIAFGYVMNHVIPRWQSTRNRALIDALYDSLT